MRALARIVEAQAGLPMARVWGEGLTSSSDGQFFAAAGAGEAMNLVNARLTAESREKAYAHLSDQFAPFAVRAIPATAHEAPLAIVLGPMADKGSLLDGLLGCEAGRRVREHHADTGGFAASRGPSVHRPCLRRLRDPRLRLRRASATCPSTGSTPSNPAWRRRACAP